jgi:antitoxin component of MazEF toxin-antitoxin module
MKKIIKKWGDSLVIRFSPDDVKIFNLKEGDIVEINDKVFTKLKK